MTLAEAQRPERMVLWAEFIALYFGAPLALWIVLPFTGLFAPLAGMMLIGFLLLIRTPGFAWRELVDVDCLRETWPMIAGFGVLTALIVFSLAYTVMNDRFMQLAREKPLFLLIIWTLYPWFSVLGQEVLYRPLFFRRYGELFPSETVAVIVNALVFALAHAFYERWLTFLLTLGGGWMFAWIYARTRSFSTVFVLHWIAGGLVFTSGLGWYFYHGAIGQ